MHTYDHVYTYEYIRKRTFIHTHSTYMHTQKGCSQPWDQEHWAIWCIGVPSCLAPPFLTFLTFPLLRENKHRIPERWTEFCVLWCISGKYMIPHETTRNHHETSHETTRILSTTPRNHLSIEKRFSLSINDIYRIHRFRGKYGKNRVVSWVVSLWFRVVSMCVDWMQCRRVLSTGLSSPNPSMFCGNSACM